MAAYGWLELLSQAELNRRLDAQRASEALDTSVPVAALPKASFSRATRVELVDGTPVFRDEVPIKVYPGQEKRLSHPGDEVAGRTLTWRALDVVTIDAKAKRHTAVVTTYPYSTDWFDAAPFKRTLHGRSDQIEQARRAALAHAAGHLAYLRNEISFDLFETRAGYLTASLTDPSRSPGDVATGRRWDRWTGGRIVPLPRTVNDPEHGVRQMKKRIDEAWVFGVCPDVTACRDALRESDMAKELLDRTRDRSVLERHYHGRRGVRAKELRQDVVPYAPDVLESSIAKSLAGPLDFRESTRRTEPYRVEELMRDVYLATIYALNERNSLAAKEAKKNGAPPGSEALPGEALPEDNAEPDPLWFARQLDAYAWRLEQAAAPGTVGEATRALWSMIPEQRFEACFVLAALARLQGTTELPVSELEDVAATDPHPDVQAVARMTLEMVGRSGGR